MVHNIIMGALSYADDITLSCPSVQGLNKMMNSCSDFSTNNCITFNVKKTICIKYGESIKLTEHSDILRVLLLYLNLFVVLIMVHFYGNITVIDLENSIHSGKNVLEELLSSIYHT